jgi:hypothetical protein
MPQIDAMQFVNCKKASNDEIYTINLTGTRIQELYKYPTTLFFKDEKINKIEVQPFANTRNKTDYFVSSGIEEFEQIKKVVSDKYELLAKPTKISIEEYNNNPYTELHWVFKSNFDDVNLILLILNKTGTKSPDKYVYSGNIQYLSSEESEIYKEKLDSKIIKSDDL